MLRVVASHGSTGMNPVEKNVEGLDRGCQNELDFGPELQNTSINDHPPLRGLPQAAGYAGGR